MDVVPLRVIEAQPLFLVHPGGKELTSREQARPEGVMGLEQEVRVVEALGQAQELLAQRPHRLIGAARVKHLPEAPQHAEELLWLPHVLTQRAGAGVEPFHFWGSPAPSRLQRHAEGHLHAQLLLVAFARLWEGGKQV
jgi:hypothetical protein